MEVYGDLEFEKAIDSLQKWFEANKKLPNKIDRICLKRFYCRSSKNTEECQKLLELHYNIRHKSPHIYEERDPESQGALQTNSYVDILQLPGLTADGYRVELAHLKTSDPKFINLTEDVKYYIMINDSRFCQPDVLVDSVPVLAVGAIQIIDMKGFTLKHLTHLSFSAMQLLQKYVERAYALLIKDLHIINCPSYMNKIMAVMRPFLSKKISDKMHLHMADLSSLYDFVPKEMLPEEYGGYAGKMSVLSAETQKIIQEKRDYLMDPNYWKIN